MIDELTYEIEYVRRIVSPDRPCGCGGQFCVDQINTPHARQEEAKVLTRLDEAGVEPDVAAMLVLVQADALNQEAVSTREPMVVFAALALYHLAVTLHDMARVRA